MTTTLGNAKMESLRDKIEDGSEVEVKKEKKVVIKSKKK